MIREKLDMIKISFCENRLTHIAEEIINVLKIFALYSNGKRSSKTWSTAFCCLYDTRYKCLMSLIYCMYEKKNRIYGARTNPACFLICIVKSKLLLLSFLTRDFKSRAVKTINFSDREKEEKRKREK